MYKKYEVFLGIILLSIVIIMSIICPDEFLSKYTFFILINQIPEFGIISLSIMILMLLGHFNLSAISMSRLAGIVGAIMMINIEIPDYLTAIIGVFVIITVGLLCGMVNGAVVSFVGVPSIIATFAMMLLFEGIASFITHGGAISNFNQSFLWIGNGSIIFIPIPLIIFIIVIWITSYLLNKSEFGKYIYIVGEDEKAANYSGIHIKKIIFLTYCYAGILIGIATVIMTSRYNSIRADYGTSYLLKSIAAVTLGGVNVNGGKGNIFGVILSVCILSVLFTGLNFIGLSQYLIDLLMGLILLLVLFSNHLLIKYKKVLGE